MLIVQLSFLVCVNHCISEDKEIDVRILCISILTLHEMRTLVRSMSSHVLNYTEQWGWHYDGSTKITLLHKLFGKDQFAFYSTSFLNY
jgi:hypothetical protein